MENRITVYYAAVLQLLQRQRHAEAFELLERSRSRVLAEMLAAKSPELRGAAERALVAEAARLRASIAQAQAQLAEAGGAGADATGARAEALARTLRDDEAKHAATLARIEREAPRLAGLVAERPASLAALQASMRAEGYEVLQYLVTDSALIAWHLSADAVLVRNVFLPRPELMRKVAALRESLANPGVPYDDKTAGELYLYLVQPLLAGVRTDRLVVLPHEALNGLPFAALRDPQTGQYLGQRFALSYAPSASVLLRLAPARALAGARVVAFADPTLDAQGQELAAIRRLFGARAWVPEGPPPPKPELMEGLAGHDVVHLALHGRYEATEPMRSYLALPGARGDAGRLTAAEMFGLPLDGTRLVVLSACESGRAEATHANETLGMSRGLLYAGAQSLLLSQWAVDSEATSAWMQAFYEAAQQRPLAEAVRIASMRVRASPGRAHPFYWAAFTLLAR